MGLFTKTALPSLFPEEAQSAEAERYIPSSEDFQHLSVHQPEEKSDTNQGKMILGFLRA